MTPEQKRKNKDYILKNLDKYVIDSRQNFFNDEVERDELEYSYIDKDALPYGAFEEIRDKIYRKIVANKYDWEITDNNSESWHIFSTPVYQHKTTNMTYHSAGFTWTQNNHLKSILKQKIKNNIPTDNPSPRPWDNDSNVVNRRRQTAIGEIEDQFAISNITIDEIESLARNYVSIENVGRERRVWPLSEWKSKINRLSESSEISDFQCRIQGFIHAVVTRRNEGDYETKVSFGSDWYDNWQRDNNDYLRRMKEDSDNFWRDFDRRCRADRNKTQRNENWREKYLREKKEEAIDKIEEYLIKKNISEEELNKKIRKSDWRQEINKFSDYYTERILRKQFFLEDEIDKLSRRFTCAGCGRNRDDIYFPHEEDGKKFCIDYLCWEKYRKSNGKPEFHYKSQVKDNTRIRDLKSFLEERIGETEFRTNIRFGQTEKMVGKNPLALLLEWMRREGITDISLDNNKLVINFGNRTKTLDDSNLTPEQVQLREFLKSNSSKKSLRRDELEQFTSLPNGSRDNEGNNKAGIIAALLVAGLIFAVIVGFVVGQRKEKNIK